MVMLSVRKIYPTFEGGEYSFRKGDSSTMARSPATPTVRQTGSAPGGQCWLAFPRHAALHPCLKTRRTQVSS